MCVCCQIRRETERRVEVQWYVLVLAPKIHSYICTSTDVPSLLMDSLNILKLHWLLWAKKDENTSDLNYSMWQPLDKIIIAASKKTGLFLFFN